MSAIETRPTGGRMRCNRVRRLWYAGTDRVAHRMVMGQCGWVRAGRRPHVVLLCRVCAASSHGGIANALSCLVGWVVE